MAILLLTSNLIKVLSMEDSHCLEVLDDQKLPSVVNLRYALDQTASTNWFKKKCTVILEETAILPPALNIKILPTARDHQTYGLTWENFYDLNIKQSWPSSSEMKLTVIQICSTDRFYSLFQTPITFWNKNKLTLWSITNLLRTDQDTVTP